jgi:peroxiredoxin
VFFIIALAYIYLFNFRNNAPLDIGVRAPDFDIKTLDNKNFKLSDIHLTKAIIFFKDNTFFTKHYLQFIKELKELNKNNSIYLLLFFDTRQEPSKILSIIHKNKDLKQLEDITYITNIKKVAKQYGIKSWPHFYLLNENNIVIYQAKTPSINKLKFFQRG